MTETVERVWNVKYGGDNVLRHYKLNIQTVSQIIKNIYPPSLAMTECEAGWNPTMPATLSLANITMVTVSELGRIRLPPSVLTRPIMRLSLSSGSISSLITISIVFFRSPVSREDKVHARLVK